MKIRFAGGTRYEIETGTHTVVTDQPIGDGGADAGMSPVELFVGSLAACVGYFVGRYCMRHAISLEGFAIDVNWSMAEQPHRVGTIKLLLHLPTTLTPEHREKLLKVAHGCTVHQSLAVPPPVNLTISAG